VKQAFSPQKDTLIPFSKRCVISSVHGAEAQLLQSRLLPQQREPCVVQNLNVCVTTFPTARSALIALLNYNDSLPAAFFCRGGSVLHPSSAPAFALLADISLPLQARRRSS
jgi:hypothetical protein